MSEPPDEGLVEHALKLIVRIDLAPAAEAERLRARLLAWRRRAPEREVAALEAEQRWAMLGGMAGQLRERFELPPEEEHGSHRRTRRGLVTLFAAGGATLLAGGAYWRWDQPRRYHTGTAQLLTVQLDDATDAAPTRLDLNARTDIAVDLRRGSREILLERGELRCDVAHDPSRPLRVRTRQGVVEVLGTVFSVSDRGGAVSVAVESGHVRFLPLARGRPLDLYAGDTLTAEPDGSTVRLRMKVADMAAWRDGWLVFDNIALDQALPAINAYRTQPILAADRSVGALRLTGRFRSQDSATLLAALPGILPLRVASRADGAVLLQAR